MTEITLEASIAYTAESIHQVHTAGVAGTRVAGTFVYVDLK